MDDQKVTEAFQKLSDRVHQLEANDADNKTKLKEVKDQLDDLNEMIEERPEHINSKNRQ